MLTYARDAAPQAASVTKRRRADRNVGLELDRAMIAETVLDRDEADLLSCRAGEFADDSDILEPAYVRPIAKVPR